MITYVFSDNKKPLYEQLTAFIKRDIEAGRFAADEKLPSKRSLAKNLGISVITVETAYQQLISEGYLYAQEKRGYFVTDIRSFLREEKSEIQYQNEQHAELGRLDVRRGASKIEGFKKQAEKKPDQSMRLPAVRWDLSGNHVSPERFPFSVWTKLTRRVLAEDRTALLTPSPPTGIRPLREAIAGHLGSFRGLMADPDQIVVGAGTEYLYGLILQLIGRDKVYCLENPGYKKAAEIYRMNGAKICFAGMDEQGILPDELFETGADVAHISPGHHFPTGITMPVRRRHEILQWASDGQKISPDTTTSLSEKKIEDSSVSSERYIIEDDFDSEFRLSGKPIPTMFSIDNNEKVIYINTFSKSLSPTIRVSYMVLPFHLAKLFREKLQFYSCTVPNLVQYTLAAFLSEGYFERHINRMRLFYAKKRRNVLLALTESGLAEKLTVQEEESGLHFTLRFHTEKDDRALQEEMAKKGIRMIPLSAYDHLNQNPATHTFILNYSEVAEETLPEAFSVLKELL